MHTKRMLLSLWVVGTLTSVLPPGDAVAEYRMDCQVISAGAGASSSSSYGLGASAGQVAPCQGTSENHGILPPPPPEPPLPFPGCCLPPLRGNVDYDPLDVIDIGDLVYMVDYMFTGGLPPPCVEEGNLDATDALGDGEDLSDIDISDLVFLVDYMFNQGPEPLPCP